MNARVQIIERDGAPEYAVVPYAEWRRLLELAEDAEDIAAYDQAIGELERGEDELIPSEVVHALLDGESPLRVWREYRGLSQAALATQAGVTQGAIAQIEGGSRKGSVKTLRLIARTLGVDLDDLVQAHPPHPE